MVDAKEASVEFISKILPKPIPTKRKSDCQESEMTSKIQKQNNMPSCSKEIDSMRMKHEEHYWLKKPVVLQETTQFNFSQELNLTIWIPKEINDNEVLKVLKSELTFTVKRITI